MQLYQHNPLCTPGGGRMGEWENGRMGEWENGGEGWTLY